MQLILGALRVQLSGNRSTVCSTDTEEPAGLRVSQVPDICTESKVRCLCLWWDGKGQFCLAVSRAAPQTTTRPLPLLMEKEPVRWRKIFMLVPCVGELQGVMAR